MGTKKQLGINFIRNAYILYKEDFKTLKADLNNWNIFLKQKTKNLMEPFLSEL